MFSPIAIVGRGCVLPGACSPAEFASLVLEGRDAITPAPRDRWGLARHHVIGPVGDASGDRAWTDRGGYVTGFDRVFDPSGFGIAPDDVTALDPLFQWTLHVARETLRDASVDPRARRTGAILGNLSFPSAAMARYAEHAWLAQSSVAPNGPTPDARNRFMSGLPAHLLGPALGIDGPRFCLDAACASSLYAIALACDALHDGRADVMLAGAVNCADDLFIHIGFCTLSAMSRTGQSRPFHADADGLVPAEGCAMVALERLDDAVARGHRVLGVIRGVGLANDGRARGLLAPSSQGQVRAMRAAWSRAGMDPSSAQYVECHATGTPVGDATELHSMHTVFGAAGALPIGSFKANVGHLVTAAGAAGLMKVLAGLEADAMPPTPHVDRPTEALRETGFDVVTARRPWPKGATPRVAAVSAFGFGGNNAHVVVEEYVASHPYPTTAVTAEPARVAVVALGARVGDGRSAADLAHDVIHGRTRVRRRDDGVMSAHADEVTLAMEGLRFPPTDLELSLAQQTLLLAAAREALDAFPLPSEHVGVVVGMQCDVEVARFGARWRLAERAESLGATHAWTAAARDAVVPALKPATVLGTMPNIPANRLNAQFDLRGASYTVSAEERSGLVALSLAARALREGELDVAVVGATDACAEPVHESAVRAVTGAPRVSGDAAVVLVLMRERDAVEQGRSVLAVLDDDATPTLALGDGGTDLSPLFGSAHAAQGLVHVAAAVLAVHHGAHVSTSPVTSPKAWSGARVASVTTSSLRGPASRVIVRNANDRAAPLPTQPPAPTGPTLRMRAHRPQPVIPTMKTETAPLPSVMEPAPRLPAILDLAVSESRAPAPPPAVAPKPVVAPLPVVAPPPALTPVITQAAPPTIPFAPHTMDPSNPYADILARAADFQRHLGEMHRAYIEQQTALHQQFLALRQRMTQSMIAGGPPVAAPVVTLPAPVAAPVVAAPVVAAPVVAARAPVAAAPVAPVPVAAPAAPALAAPAPATRANAAPVPKGPTFDRAALKIHAGGRISDIFGPQFAQQDDYAVQVRMPMEPMLLADRVTGIDATPGVLGKGTVWTESDVTWDAWYLHDGRMPPGVMIETGQADLFLISYMGIDFRNRGARAYRLLGCELTYHRSPPRPGETLCYDIHLDGHARQGDIGLMFFHYDCRIGAELALTVREGQAGFFSRAELDDSAGILWRPETQDIVANARVDAPPVLSKHTSFTPEQIRAFGEGDAHACFGAGFERTITHNRTPRIAPGRMTFLERITDLDPKGGPWRRGYLRAVTAVHPDDWFFPGHFLNDPCMPGTLMFDGCLQAMAFYLAAMGVTVDRDGWRFEPVTGIPYKLLCRGQVTPTSRELVYEVFVEEFHDGPEPTLYADLLCTVDGLGAFHARRVGLRLVPDWPMTSRPRLFAADAMPPAPGHEPMTLSQCDPSKPVAVGPDGPSAGFPFDYASLLACAWGRPSEAFGPMYARFDGVRKVARLPGPPYHFMSRVSHVEGPMGVAKPGALVEIDYDIPADAWYFDANGHRAMPMSVLMEAALQPCGWLASYVGCALLGDEDLLFRNLDGKGTVHCELLPTSGTLRTRSKLTNVSRSGSMIIVSFEVRCTVGATLVYSLDTVFGFFPKSAFENQAGLPVSAAQRATFNLPPKNAIDLSTRPAKLCAGSARLASPFLLMLDRVTHLDLQGGAKGLGLLRAEKDVTSEAWFFKAHFFQDPVQPGSLGIEAMCQLLQLYMLEAGMAEGLRAPRFESIAVGRELVWKYRGQVVPTCRVIGCTLEVTETGRDDRGVYAVADASLWVDGKRIYDAQKLTMRLVEGDTDPDGETLDPKSDTWVNDHCPTWTLPALPAMSMLDRIAGAASRASGKPVTAVEDLRIARWIVLPGPTKLRTVVNARDDGGYDVALEVFREARDARLSRFEPAATAVVRVGAYDVAPDARATPAGYAPADDPYASGALFHGPAFQRLRALRMGSDGSASTLDATVREVPLGHLNQALLDAATHGIPHDAMERWCPDVPRDRAAYPHRIERARFFGPTPRDGDVRCEARSLGWDGAHARVALQLIHHDRVWCELVLAEVLLPKGPIGTAPPAARRAFLRDRQFAPDVALSRVVGDETVLDVRDVAASNWLPGTVERVYGVSPDEELSAAVVIRDHVGQRARSHPSRVRVTGDSAVSSHEPLTRHTVSLSRDNATVTARDAAPPTLDLTPVHAFWREVFGRGPWPGEDLYYGLIERFVRRVRLEDPDAHARLRGKSVLFLGNHQVGVESLLFGIVASALNGLTTVTLAKAEHRDTWLGGLIAHGFSYPGVRDPGVIAYFDRSDPASLPTILRELGAAMAGPGKNLMIHVEGTRALTCRQPVTRMSGVLLDMALAMGVPVVPVRFVGGVAVEPMESRLEFPLHMGRQDYVIGAPILPETLAALPYRDRVGRVLDALNNLAPTCAVETPFAGDPAFEASVREWEARTGAMHAHAVLYRTLEALPTRSPEIDAMVRGAHAGHFTPPPGPEGAWIAGLARRFYGPRGPIVTP